MFDFNTKTAAVGVIGGAAIFGAGQAVDAAERVNLPTADNRSSTDGVPAVYTHNFSPIVDARKVTFSADTAESGMFFQIISGTSGSGQMTGSADVEFELDGIWTSLGTPVLGPIEVFDSQEYFLNDPGFERMYTFEPATVTGVRLSITPNIDATLDGGAYARLLARDDSNNNDFNYLLIDVVPEPASLALIGLGGLLLLRRNRS